MEEIEGCQCAAPFRGDDCSECHCSSHGNCDVQAGKCTCQPGKKYSENASIFFVNTTIQPYNSAIHKAKGSSLCGMNRLQRPFK